MTCNGGGPMVGLKAPPATLSRLRGPRRCAFLTTRRPVDVFGAARFRELEAMGLIEDSGCRRNGQIV